MDSKRLTGFACLSLTLAVVPAFAADVFPTKPVRIVVPFAAGGGVDLTARILAQKLTERVGTSFIVDNRVGASGIIGTEFVAKSPPDGYTLLVGSQTSQAVVPAMYAKQVTYDTSRDFVGITQIAVSPLVIVIHPSLPVKSVKDLIALAKARPGQLTYGAASGGTPHMAGELFKLQAKVDMLFVPYKGEGPAIADALGGQISMVFSNLPVGMPQAQSGRLRALAVTSKQRVATAPDVPTAAESGLPGYEASTWFGLFAPAATPREIVAKLNADAAAALNAADAKEKMAGQGLFVVASTPEQFADFVKAEIPRWAKIVRDAGIKPQ
ncbi:MAG: tripartite tricarboxylate transporter substrate binding protein [Betaproteobacteria bacterium]|nr:tripartite tricarboxylate transporter substrate binding protein [Betaproteobacteria bacterium]